MKMTKILFFSLIILKFVTLSLAQEWEWSLAAKPDLAIGIIGISMLNDGLTGWAVGNDSYIGRIYHTIDGWKTWEEQTAKNLTNLRFRDVSFTNELNGWIVGNDGIILHTLDGGKNWEIQARNLTVADLRKVSAVDANHAVACGSNGTIIYTNDGKNWSPVKMVKMSNEFMGISMYDEGHGIAVGKSETILYTIDGVNWNVASGVPGISGKDFNAVCMIDERTAWVAGSGDDFTNLKSVLAKTTDGGNTWALWTPPEIICENLWAIDFASPTTGVAVGARGTVFISRDANNWTVLPRHFGNDSKAVAMVGDKIWATSLFGTINSSENLGASWSILPHLTANFLYKICTIDNDRIITVGYASSVVTTEDGGLTWKTNSLVADNSISQQLWGIAFANSRIGWVAGAGGFLAKTNSGGQSWSRQGQCATNNWLKDIWVYDENMVWIVGIVGEEGIILKSADGGENWILQNKGIPSVNFYDIDGVDQNHLAIVGDKSTLLYTLDGGTTWLKAAHNLPGLKKIHALHIVDQSRAWAVGASGTLLFSSDAGINWSLQRSPTDLDLDGVHFKDNATGYIVGQKGVIFETTDGGNSWNRMAQGITDQDLKSIAITFDGKIFVCGYNGVVMRYGPPLLPSVNPAKDHLLQNFYLGQSYPNPFNGTMNFNFQVPRTAKMTIAVYNMSGQLIAILVNEIKMAGWYPVTWNGITMPSGIYFIKMKTENFTAVRKALLVK